MNTEAREVIQPVHQAMHQAIEESPYSCLPYFDAGCRDCPRLFSFLSAERRAFPDYHNGPVESFGDPRARLIIVGLAPGFHGANRTGRPFTGDHAGMLLFQILHRLGFANRSESVARDDGLELINCRITNSVKCVPPENKPMPGEIRNCNRFLAAEMEAVPDNAVIVALGTIAHQATLTAFGLPYLRYKFSHSSEHQLPRSITLLDSFHASRYNTQTRRLTEEMFTAVFNRASELLAA